MNAFVKNRTVLSPFSRYLPKQDCTLSSDKNVTGCDMDRRMWLTGCYISDNWKKLSRFYLICFLHFSQYIIWFFFKMTFTDSALWLGPSQFRSRNVRLCVFCPLTKEINFEASDCPQITWSVPRHLIGPPPLRWLPSPSQDAFQIGCNPDRTRSKLDTFRIGWVLDQTRFGLDAVWIRSGLDRCFGLDTYSLSRWCSGSDWESPKNKEVFRIRLGQP